MSTLAAASHPNVLHFQEAWEEKSQLHIRTALAECGDFATYLQTISDEGGLDEARCWKVLRELTEVCTCEIWKALTDAIFPGPSPHPLTWHPPPGLETGQHSHRSKRNIADQRLWIVNSTRFLDLGRVSRASGRRRIQRSRRGSRVSQPRDVAGCVRDVFGCI